MKRDRIALYARTSKGGVFQDPEHQLDKLREWAKNARVDVVGEFVDRISSRDTRPQKEEVLRRLRVKEIDGVAFFCLDRWGRNVSELVLELEEAQKREWKIVSLREGLNFDTAAGRMYSFLLAVFADFERNRIQERVLSGLKTAKTRGKILGRHPNDCGCGRRDEDGSKHDGSIKPMRSDSNEHVGWKFPDGREVAIGLFRKKPNQTPSRDTRATVSSERPNGNERV